MNKEVCRVCIFKFLKERLSDNRLGVEWNEMTQQRHEQQFSSWFQSLSEDTGSAAPCPYMVKNEGHANRKYYPLLGDFFWFAQTVKIPESCQYRFEQVVSIGVR